MYLFLYFFTSILLDLDNNRYDFNYQLDTKNIEQTISKLKEKGSEIEIEYADSVTKKQMKLDFSKEYINKFNATYSLDDLKPVYSYNNLYHILCLQNLYQLNNQRDVSGWTNSNIIIDYASDWTSYCFWNMPSTNISVTPMQLYKFQYNVYKDVISVINPNGISRSFYEDTFVTDIFYFFLYYMRYFVNISLFMLILRFLLIIIVKYRNKKLNATTRQSSKKSFRTIVTSILQNFNINANIIGFFILGFFVLFSFNGGKCIYRYSYEGDLSELTSTLHSIGLQEIELMESGTYMHTDTLYPLSTEYVLIAVPTFNKYNSTYVGGWYKVDNYAVNIMVDASNYGCLLLSEYVNLETEEKSQSWFFTYKNWPWTKQYHASPFRLLYLNYIINRDFISKTPFNFDTIVNTSEIIAGYMKYTILYYGNIIFPIWLLLLFSSIVYKHRKRKKEYENFKKQFPPFPPTSK